MVQDVAQLLLHEAAGADLGPVIKRLRTDVVIYARRKDGVERNARVAPAFRSFYMAVQ